MHEYTIQIWYRYGKFGDDKDSFELSVQAETDEQAHKIARESRTNIINTYIKTKDGEKIS